MAHASALHSYRLSSWYRDYITTLVQRDVKELACIHKLDVLPRLLALSADQTARLFNAADLASPFSLSRPTIREYLTLLEQSLTFFHFRNRDKVEVDIVIEQGNQIAGIEVKAAATVTSQDFKGLNKLKAAIGKAFIAGVVFYDGESIIPFGDKLFAVPISLLTPQIIK